MASCAAGFPELRASPCSDLHGRRPHWFRRLDQRGYDNEEPPPRGEREHLSQGYHDEIQDKRDRVRDHIRGGLHQRWVS
jgi:hypothetical protein